LTVFLQKDSTPLTGRIYRGGPEHENVLACFTYESADFGFSKKRAGSELEQPVPQFQLEREQVIEARDKELAISRLRGESLEREKKRIREEQTPLMRKHTSNPTLRNNT